MTTTLSELIVRSSHAALGSQRSNGSMEAGCNGPHQDPETPVRNTCHWLINWCFSYRKTQDRIFLDAASRAADYVMSNEARPLGKAFPHRNKAGKDKCNGVMGPSFCIEGLVQGGSDLERPEMLELAAEIISNHPFDGLTGLWKVWEVDGKILPQDPTLNHQLWFAATISLLNKVGNPTGQEEVRAFLHALSRNLAVNKDGRVKHLARTLVHKNGIKGLIKDNLPSTRKVVDKKENAYHTYNLYPLAMLRENVGEHAAFQLPAVRKAVAFLYSDQYEKTVLQPSFVQPYIPAGFPYSFAERAYIDEQLSDNDRACQKRLIQLQVDRLYNAGTGMFDRNSIDPVTQSARLYEATRVPDAEVVIAA